MRLLHFADLHLDATFAWAPPDVARRRRDDLRQALVRIIDVARDRNVDAILCGGDLFEHERVTPDTVAFLRSQFGRVAPIAVYIAPGNHDHCSVQSIYRRTSWSANVHVFTSDALTPTTLADGFTLWGAAHLVPANTGDFLSNFHIDRGGINIALFHGSERSELPVLGVGKQPYGPFDAIEVERSGLAHLLTGHFHTPKDAALFTYPGNPEALTFGETGSRGAVLVSIEGTSGMAREHISVAGPSGLHDLSVDVNGCSSSSECLERVQAALSGLRGCAKVRLTGDVDPAVSLVPRQLEECAPHLDAVVADISRLGAAYDFDQIKGEHSVRGRFVSDVLADEALADNERRLILTAGLRALDGRDDLKVV